MFNKLFFVLFFLVFAIASISFAGTIQLSQTGQITCYDSSGNEIDCSGTGQDGEIQAGVAWPNPRFFNNPDGTVTDSLTGLIWATDASTPIVGFCNGGTKAWQESLDYIVCLNDNNYLGHNDWILPNVNELESLVNSGEPNIATWLTSQGFNGVQSGNYWSSTTYVHCANCAWEVNFQHGSVYGYYKNDQNNVWPLRSEKSGHSIISLPITGQTVSYDANMPQRDDGATDMQRGVSWPIPRFVDNTDGTVIDNLSGLMWTKSTDLTHRNLSWDDALDYIQEMNDGIYENFGHNDWRLPNRREIGSIVDVSNIDPALPLEHPFTIGSYGGQWSSTSLAGEATRAVFFSLHSGDRHSNGKVLGGALVWPVRTPPPLFITAPLHDEEGLIMTNRDYSNFATREYFSTLRRTNHHGVDLALSQTGTRTASQVTAGKTVYAICDGQVEFIHNGGGLYSFAKIRHPNCNGQEIIAYYGHIAVIDGLTEVKTDEPIGTVKDWQGNSHLHLTIDTQTDRNLSRINQVVCDYTLDTNQTVTSLSNCSNATGKLTKNKMLLRIGWGQVKTLRYKDSRDRTYSKKLYISEDAIRQLGFISFFDLY